MFHVILHLEGKQTLTTDECDDKILFQSVALLISSQNLLDKDYDSQASIKQILYIISVLITFIY